MTNQLKISVTLQALDKLTKPFQGMIKTSRTLSSRIGKTQKQLADLKAVQRNISGYRASKRRHQKRCWKALTDQIPF